jgi:DNA-binding response OmpR family regulator
MRDSASHILIVDDDPSIIEALTAGLTGPYVVHGAGTGEEACAILQSHPVAAVILDAVLGHEHGLDLIERFRAISPVPVLLLTGYGSEELIVLALRAKVTDYLRKPVNLRELQEALARVLNEQAGTPDPVLGGFASGQPLE